MIGLDTLFRRLIYPDFELESIEIEDIFERILSSVNSEVKYQFLKYCSNAFKLKDLDTWNTLMFEHFFFASIGKKKNLLFEIEGGIKYSKIDELVELLMLGRKEDLSKIIQKLPLLIENEKFYLDSLKKINPKKRGSKYSFEVNHQMIDLDKLFRNLITEKQIPQDTPITDFANIFNNNNVSNINPITWIGRKYHLLGLFRILLNKKVINLEHKAIFEIIDLVFINQNGIPFNTIKSSSEFSRIFNESSDKNKIELKAIGKKAENKLLEIVESSLITPK